MLKPVTYGELHAAPWKNGGGVTRELASFPPGAGFDDFLWRVSIAEVGASGPFSSFPGIDRIIVLLDGAGMHLQFSDGCVHALTDKLTPYAFPGEAQLHAELVSPSRDFNLMTRRGRAQGEIAVCRESFTAHGDCRSMLMFCADGAWQIGDECLLQQGDHLLLEPPANIPVRQMGANGALLCVQIMLSE